jgi:hypothetical protein
MFLKRVFVKIILLLLDHMSRHYLIDFVSKKLQYFLNFSSFHLVLILRISQKFSFDLIIFSFLRNLSFCEESFWWNFKVNNHFIVSHDITLISYVSSKHRNWLH